MAKLSVFHKPYLDSRGHLFTPAVLVPSTAAMSKASVDTGWHQHQMNSMETTSLFACIYCVERRTVAVTTDGLWEPAEKKHRDKLPSNSTKFQKFKSDYVSACERSASFPQRPQHSTLSCRVAALPHDHSLDKATTPLLFVRL